MEPTIDLDNRSGDVVDRLHEDLRRDLAELVTSEDWREALAVAARFHDYSFSNTRLIWAQAAARGFEPTRVAGYRTWRELGRQVRRAEKGLAILAPIVRLVELDDGTEERRVVGAGRSGQRSIYLKVVTAPRTHARAVSGVIYGNLAPAQLRLRRHDVKSADEPAGRRSC